MDKLIYTGDNDALVQACGGVVAAFFDSDHLKTAASSAFSQSLLREFAPDDNHFGIHLIAMGCGEDYGFNKNGDWWTRDGLKHNTGSYGAHTFVKNGAYYLEHNNRGPEVARGSIKAARYNDDMQRVELVVWGDKRKAEEDYQHAKTGKTLTFSMSARVPDDECSCCGHRAKSSRNYCGHLKHSMTKWLAPFSKFAYAINHKPNFFDISRVRNPADRIAHWLEYIMPEAEMAKAASENGSSFLFSDLQAKIAGVNLPEEVRLGCSTAERNAILRKLAAAEEYFQALERSPGLVARDARRDFAKNAAPYAFDPFAITDVELAAMRKLEPDVLMGQLAKRAAVLPFLTFYAYATGKTVKQAAEDPVFHLAQENFIPEMFNRALTISADSATEDLFRVAPSEKIAACCTGDPVDQILESVAEKTTVQQPKVQVRILRICSSTPESCDAGVKLASDISQEQTAQAHALVHAYALYKVAFVEAVSEAQGQLSVDEPVLMLLTYPQKV